MKRPYVFLLILTALISACSQQPVREHSSYTRIGVGSIVELKQTLKVPPGDARLFIQHGEVLNGGLDHYAPSCNFEVRSISGSRLILPGRFPVTRLQYGDEQVVSLEPIKVAGRRLTGILHREGGPPMITRFVHFWLQADDQPDLMRLTCRGALADLHEAERPTVSEMAEALGDIATIEPVF